MHPKITSRVLLAFALAAGLSFATAGEVRAQHSGHQGHEGHGTKKPAKKAPAKKRSQHGGHGAAAPAVAEYQGAHHKMMRDMSVPYTGDPDVDFRVQMIPHHQGAIDMARVALRHATDPWTRQWPKALSSSNSARLPRCSNGSRAGASRRLWADSRATPSRRTRIGPSRKSREPEPSCADSRGRPEWACRRLQGEARCRCLRAAVSPGAVDGLGAAPSAAFPGACSVSGMGPGTQR